MPVDERNERFEELAAHPNWSFCSAHFGKQELLQQRDRVFARHPRTTFVAAHVAERAEELSYVSGLLERYPNVLVDIGARSAELGRQPYAAREFFLKHSDRILFGTDLVPEVGMYRLHFRFLETADEYFEYPSHASRQGRWNIYGLFLPDDVLRRVYRENALRVLASMSPVVLSKSPDVHDRLQIPPDRLPPTTKGSQRAPGQDWLRPVSTGESVRIADAPIGSGCF